MTTKSISLILFFLLINITKMYSNEQISKASIDSLKHIKLDTLILSRKTKKEITRELNKIVALLQKDKVEEFNEKYVHPEFGLNFIYRIGVPDVMSHKDSVERIDARYMSNPYYSLFNQDNWKKYTKAKFKWVESSITFDCGEWKYSDSGNLITRKINYPSYSEQLVSDSLMLAIQPTEKDKKYAKHLDNNSIQITITALELTFYLGKINGKWYVTTIDEVSTDCSA